jgi:hypothetical protein
MNPILKSRDYHRSYQKWETLLLEGKVDEITITPGAKSEVFFTLTLKKKPRSNAARILEALEQLPTGSSSLNDIREDYDSEYRI